MLAYFVIIRARQRDLYQIHSIRWHVPTAKLYGIRNRAAHIVVMKHSHVYRGYY